VLWLVRHQDAERLHRQRKAEGRRRVPYVAPRPT
jgi:hypothetical protein